MAEKGMKLRSRMLKLKFRDDWHSDVRSTNSDFGFKMSPSGNFETDRMSETGQSVREFYKNEDKKTLKHQRSRPQSAVIRASNSASYLSSVG